MTYYESEVCIMKLEDAIIVALYFLFNGELLSTSENSKVFIEANKVIEQRAKEILDES